MTINVSLQIGRCDESAARLYFDTSAGIGLSVKTPTLYGPVCEYARTLATQYALQPCESELLAVLVTEPCYWTPRLPFLYDFVVGDETRRLGIKRWSANGSSWQLEGKRVVLRGCVLESLEIDWLTARDSETTLICTNYDESQLNEADAQGVGLILDLRGYQKTLSSLLDKLRWHPSVLAVILDAKQQESITDSNSIMVGIAVGSDAEEIRECPADFFFVEIGEGESPAAWFGRTEKPVVSLRRDTQAGDFSSVRAACDRLQAELAPQFDLAGYFVAK